MDARISLAPFKNAIGAQFDKCVNDVNSALGRELPNLKTANGNWKLGAKGKMVAKDNTELYLPLNNSAFALVRFGIQLNEISTKGSTLRKDGTPDYTMDIQAEIPAACIQWINTTYKGVKSALDIKPMEVVS